VDEVLILYLVNLWQPVELARLRKELNRYHPREEGSKPSRVVDLDATVKKLLLRKLILQAKGRYSVTLKGLESVSALGLGRLRDKFRLFNLKRAM